MVSEVTAHDTTSVSETTSRAARAAEAWRAMGPARRADALDAVADALDAHVDELVGLADAETSLGETRLRGEVARTTGQLRLFGTVLREGSYLEPILDSADPAAGRPALARTLEPVGPVAVYAASNFPFAFSVAGGDTASALAAGCPVVVKAHPGHPRTSRRTAELVADALTAAGAPEGVFALVEGFEEGLALVTDPAIKAAGFTGSRAGGRALYDKAAARPEPIPFYGELGSVNPVVVLPGAARERAGEIATGYAASLTLGVGQFCTNPGLLFVPEDDDELRAEIAEAVSGTSGGTMLTAGMRDAYETTTAKWAESVSPRLLAEGQPGSADGAATPRVFVTTLAEFGDDLDRLSEECFGPAGIVVTYDSLDKLIPILNALGGNLTGSVHAAEADREAAARLAVVLRRTTGRVIFNGWPTGVAVSWAMHHGGPWPATTASAHTSVGTTAIRRWLTPVCYQDWPDDLLPPQLQDANPLGVPRRRDGVLGTR